MTRPCLCALDDVGQRYLRKGRIYRVLHEQRCPARGMPTPRWDSPPIDEAVTKRRRTRRTFAEVMPSDMVIVQSEAYGYLVRYGGRLYELLRKEKDGSFNGGRHHERL